MRWDFEDICGKQAWLTLGVSEGALPIAKDTGWRNKEMKQIINTKKDFTTSTVGEEDRTETKWNTLKSRTKLSTAQAIAISRLNVYDRLENATKVNTIYIYTKSNKHSKDEHKTTTLTTNDAIY